MSGKPKPGSTRSAKKREHNRLYSQEVYRRRLERRAAGQGEFADDRPIPPVVPTFTDWVAVYADEINRGVAA